MANVISKIIKNWTEYQIYGSGGAAWAWDVTWPSSSTNWHLAVFSWTTGKVIKDWWAVPTVNNGTLTITQNGTSKGTFTANQSSAATIALTDTTYESKAAASWWTAVSLVTTGEKYTWNNKQNALSTQTAYSAKGTATKVPQITTNTLGQVTWITEKSITFPVTSVWGSTWAVWLKTINNNAITWSGNISVWTLTAETAKSWDTWTTYIFKVSTTAPAAWTASNIITFVIDS